MGIHPLQVDDELVANVVGAHFGDQPRAGRIWEQQLRQVRNELESTVLVEMVVHQPERTFDAMDVGQPGSDQAAWNEKYLSEDGSRVISEWDKPDDDSLRLAFYLHGFDPSKPLRTTFGEIELPARTQVPERLSKLNPYEPYD